MPSQFPRYWGCGSHAEPKPRQSDLTALRLGLLTFSEVLSGGSIESANLVEGASPFRITSARQKRR